VCNECTGLPGCFRYLRAQTSGVLGWANVGCASNSSSLELPAELASVAAHRFYSRGREIWEHPSPTVWPPDDSYRDIRQLTRELLPGRRYRRRLLWRYTVLWTKPPSPSVLTP